MKKSSKKSNVNVRFNYRNEESFLCLGLLLVRRLGRLQFTVSLYEEIEDVFIEITPRHHSCVFGSLAMHIIFDCIKEAEKLNDAWFYTIFDVKDGKPYVHIGCSKNNSLPF